ncbi:MAG: hypothetical protein IPO31_26820, partial [Candidatus Obscuribacter sp.]|nr:hypothetical protein [Candidatus Obscuribacter sp.]
MLAKRWASLASALYEKPSSKLRVLGVTGTNGKNHYHSLKSDISSILPDSKLDLL